MTLISSFTGGSQPCVAYRANLWTNYAVACWIGSQPVRISFLWHFTSLKKMYTLCIHSVYSTVCLSHSSFLSAAKRQKHKIFYSQQDSSMIYTTHISYLEIYNEMGYDLLDSRHEASRLEDLPSVFFSFRSYADGTVQTFGSNLKKAKQSKSCGVFEILQDWKEKI